VVCPHVIKFLDFLFLYLSSSYIWLKSSYGWSPLLEQYEKIEPKKYCFIWVIFGKRVCKWLFWCYVLLINILYFSIFMYVDKYFIDVMYYLSISYIFPFSCMWINTLLMVVIGFVSKVILWIFTFENFAIM
jgi:hypothetical protein